VLGPERLPAAAAWLGGAIRKAKTLAASANAQISSELGPELDQLRAPLAELRRVLRPGGRLIGIHSHGNDPGMEIIHKVWPDDNPFTTDRHQLLKAVKHELGPAGRDLNFNAYADNRSLFRYEMHTLPSEISDSIGTSTLLAAWNAAIYVAQVEEDRLAEAFGRVYRWARGSSRNWLARHEPCLSY